MKSLYPFQTEAVTKTVEELKTADRAKVIMPCGTGKTIVGIKVREQLQPKRTLIIAPTLALVEQLINTYVSEGGLQHKDNALVVCSDNTVANAARRKHDIKRATTDPNEIAKELRKRGDVVVFGNQLLGSRNASKKKEFHDSTLQFLTKRIEWRRLAELSLLHWMIR